MSDFLIGKNFVVVPKITTAQRNALTPTNGMLVYDSDLNLFYKYENGAWSSFGGGSATWGGITGTLSSQTDLQTALNAKQNSILSARLSGSNVTTTSATATNITGLVSPTLEANSIYYVSCRIRLGCSGNGGVKIAITVPSGGTLNITNNGITNSASAFITNGNSSSGTLTASAFNTGNFTSSIFVFGYISIGATTGVAQWQFASGVAGETSTIYGSNDSLLTFTKIT